MDYLSNSDNENTMTWNIVWEDSEFSDDFMNFVDAYMPDLINNLLPEAQELYHSSIALCASSAGNADDDSPSETCEVMVSDE